MIVNGSQEDPLWIATTTTFQPPPFPNEENITGVWGVVELKRRLLFH